MQGLGKGWIAAIAAIGFFFSMLAVGCGGGGGTGIVDAPANGNRVAASASTPFTTTDTAASTTFTAGTDNAAMVAANSNVNSADDAGDSSDTLTRAAKPNLPSGIEYYSQPSGRSYVARIDDNVRPAASYVAFNGGTLQTFTGSLPIRYRVDRIPRGTTIFTKFNGGSGTATVSVLRNNGRTLIAGPFAITLPTSRASERSVSVDPSFDNLSVRITVNGQTLERRVPVGQASAP